MANNKHQALRINTITMATAWLLLLLAVASSQNVETQTKTENETCTDEQPLNMLERLLNNPQQLLEQLRQLQQDNDTNHLLLHHLQQLHQDHQTNQQQLLQQFQQLHQHQQQLFQQHQTILNRLEVTEKSINASKPRNSYEIYISGERVDGVYTVYPNGTESAVEVYCDMTTDGGGWTVFQRRKDGSVDFYRNWNDYRTGFGNLTGEFWLGNDNLHLMTSDRRQRLRVDLADWEGNSSYAEFDNFRVGSLQLQYVLASLGAHHETAGDSLRSHLGMKFSTKNQDNDESSSNQCARLRQGAWWYWNCDHSNLNGLYYKGGFTSTDGVIWDDFRGHLYSLKFTEMKVRPFYAYI